jgi:hypothetical protein
VAIESQTGNGLFQKARATTKKATQTGKHKGKGKNVTTKSPKIQNITNSYFSTSPIWK